MHLIHIFCLLPAVGSAMLSSPAARCDKARVRLSDAHGSRIPLDDTRRTRHRTARGEGPSRGPEDDGDGNVQPDGPADGHHGNTDDIDGDLWPQMPTPQHSDDVAGMEEGHWDPGVTSAARQRAGHEEQWAPQRHLLLEEYLICLTENKLRVDRMKEAVQAEAVAAIAKAGAACRHCGKADGLHPRDRDAHVLWVGSSYTFELAVPIRFCQHCHQETSAQPLEAGCFPSTPCHSWDLCSAPCDARPLWFDLEMLEALDCMVCVAKRLSMDRVSEAILKAHERNGCSEYISWDVFRKRLQAAVLELGYIKAQLADMKQMGADSYPSGLFPSCGGCWFAGKPGTVGGEQYDSYPLHSLYVDFNQKLAHLRTAVGAEPGAAEPPANQRHFIRDSKGLEAIQEPTEHNDEGDKQCSTFKADEVIGRLASGKYDVNSTGVSVCRHGFVAHLLNSFTGERHAYAILFVSLILEQGIPLQFLWYDINCRWAISFRKWLEQQTAEVQRLGGDMQFPLPPWHLFAHSVQCQRRNGALLMRGAGRANGEPHENFNAQLGPMSKTTMYMSPTSRMGRLERVVQHEHEEKELRLPQQLLRMEVRAQAASGVAVHAVASVKEELQGACGLTDDQVKTRMQQHAAASTSSQPVEMPWGARLAYSMLVVHKARLVEGDTSTPGLTLLFEDAAFENLRPNSYRVKEAQAAVRRLQQEHEAELRGQDVDIGSPAFQGMLLQFVAHTAQSLQLEIEREVRQRMDVDALMPHLAERPGDQAKLRKTLARSAVAIHKKTSRLQGWLTGNFVPAGQLPLELQQLAAGAADWDLDGFCHGRFPWQEDALPLGDLTAEQLISQLVLHHRRHARAREELELISREKELSLRLYDAQLSALQQGMAANSAAAAAAHERLHSTPEQQADAALQERMVRREVAALTAKNALLNRRTAVVATIREAAVRAFGQGAAQALQDGSALPSGFPTSAAVIDQDDDGSDDEE